MVEKKLDIFEYHKTNARQIFHVTFSVASFMQNGFIQIETFYVCVFKM